MKFVKYLILLSLLIPTACSEPSEIYYTTDYPIVKVEAEVKLETPEPDPDPGTTSGITEEEPVEPENPVVTQIKAAVLEAAPVKEGGNYKLDFIVYNGGTLYITPAPDAETLTGSFAKIPGKTELTFSYGGKAYTCNTSSYEAETGNTCVRFKIDLTEEYRELYPDAKLTEVSRYEYTSHPAR